MLTTKYGEVDGEREKKTWKWQIQHFDKKEIIHKENEKEKHVNEKSHRIWKFDQTENESTNGNMPL